MTSLVTCLDMKIDEIVGAKCLNGSICLGPIICVPKTCRTWHIDDVQSSIATYSTDEVNSCNDRSLPDLRISLCEGHHLRTIAAARFVSNCAVSSASGQSA